MPLFSKKKPIPIPTCVECQRHDFDLDPRDPEGPCDLRCIANDPEELEFIGPDHLVIVNPPDELYKDTMYESATTALAYFALGATVMPIVLFALSFHLYYYVNVHVLFFTVGYQLVMPLSFLMMHRYDGAGIWVKECEKRMQAFVLRMVAFGCTLIGVWAIAQWMIFTGYMVFLRNFSIHTFTGTLSVILSVLDTITLFKNFENERSTKALLSRFICYLAFMFSSATFISGLTKSSMLKWYPTKHFMVFMIFFCLYYTFIATYRPMKNFVSEMFLRSKVNT